jgi:NADH-quinone oxidoreductase subunit G
VEGEDETFKNGFTIHAEKCPNRRGVEEVVAHYMHRVPSFKDLAAAAESGEVKAVWVTGGYKHDWVDSAVADRLRTADLLIVQDMFASPVWDRADYQLPGAAFAERDGSYVNFKDRLQSVKWAVRAPAGVRVEGTVYWELLKTTGLFKSRKVLEEVGMQIPFFGAALKPVPANGVDLKVNLLAAT